MSPTHVIMPDVLREETFEQVKKLLFSLEIHSRHFQTSSIWFLSVLSLVIVDDPPCVFMSTRAEMNVLSI
jgi:hypothetical protein